MPITKWKLVCRALNGKDEKATVKANEVKKNTSDSFLIEQLKMMIVSIEGVSDREQISQAINVMPAGDSRYLRKRYTEVVKPFKIVQNFACSKCDYEADMEVPLSADFFWFK